ncbi:hypothetical protein [Bradyrhizobium sp. CCGUVB23]|uniref:hypothetical protein n=1 Tax=Bradyrhizobium sp. CCGUVB23 TaxID=2949630 RepID=UPI0020B1861E|nr:hypothetical protein [Bradyrhizobium sp. CCGUVB23]MCP3462918.1 hypothetical protein [Bradyrhizobium sp. CCGUVB23]
MPRSPSIVPKDLDDDTYIVLDASGTWVGRTWCYGEDNHETLIRDLLDGRYCPPLRIVCFNTTEGWSRVVTTDIVAELQRRSAEGETVPAFLHICCKWPSPQRRNTLELRAAQNDLAKGEQRRGSAQDSPKTVRPRRRGRARLARVARERHLVAALKDRGRQLRPALLFAAPNDPIHWLTLQQFHLRGHIVPLLGVSLTETLIRLVREVESRNASVS